jgi:RimJ/RimL family protein N-acetyltransferase
MVGDPSARRKGVAGASLAAVTDFMSGEGFTILHARAVVTNEASARVLFRAGFACAGDPYTDPGDGLFWQNFAVRIG